MFIVRMTLWSYMDASEVVVGIKVRYPRTGTEGQVESIQEIEGETFAQIDTTHLLYRIDQIITVERFKERAVESEMGVDEFLAREKQSTEEIQKAYEHWDGECGG